MEKGIEKEGWKDAETRRQQEAAKEGRGGQEELVQHMDRREVGYRGCKQG